MGVCAEECHFAFIGVEDHFLGGAPFGDGGDCTVGTERRCRSGAESPLSPLIWTLAMRFDNKLRNQRVKRIGGQCKQESHHAALWLGGLAAVNDGLRHTENSAYSPQSQTLVSTRLYRRLRTILSIVLTT